MRAVLLLPATKVDLLRTALDNGPDLLVLDGTDASPEALASLVEQARAASPALPVFIRLGGRSGDGLEPAMAASPDGIWLRDASGQRGVEQWAARIAVLEARLDRPDGATRIVASVESAAGALAIPSLPEAGRRLAGISYDAPTLSRALGCAAESGPGTPDPIRVVRANVAIAAAAAGVPAIDSGTPAPCDPESFEAEASEARRNGFAAKLALDLEQLSALKRLGAGQALVGRWRENFVSGVPTK